MTRALLKRYFPSAESIKQLRALQFLGKYLEDPNLFHLNRHSVSKAFFWGVLIAFLPLPGQMVIAALSALLARCNLPIVVALTWVTNPFTMPFFLFITFHLGAFVLQTEPIMIEPQLTWDWISHSLIKVWKPLVIGSALGGILFGGLSYLIIQGYWRWYSIRSWQKRSARRNG